MPSSGRYQRLDSDEERLPEGMIRTGYDADEQRYYYEDADGGAWEGEPGNRYGQLHRVGQRPAREGVSVEFVDRREREAWRYFLPFLLLVGVFLLVVFRFTHGGGGPAELEPACAEGAKAHSIVSGDTCYNIATERGVSVDDLKKANEGLDCEKLQIGKWICVP